MSGLDELLPLGDAGRASVACPEAIKPFSAASREEQLRRANVVLRASRKLYRQRFGPLWQCVQTAGDARIEAEYARRLLRAMLLENDLPLWEAHPTRKRAEVYRLIDAAIRRSDQRHGGWLVGVSP